MIRFLSLLLILAPNFLLAQDGASNINSASERLEVQNKTREAMALDTYIQNIAALENLVREYSGHPALASTPRQMLGTIHSFCGQHQEALLAFDFLDNSKELDQSIINFKPVNAYEFILERTIDRQIVMINEAHHVAQHRILTYGLLQRLWDQGFRYFAVETASNGSEYSLSENALSQRFGYYTNEPIFSKLILYAKGLGFKLVSYDYSESGLTRSIQERESAGLNNIKKKVFDKDPKAKVVFHVGYAHINEQAWLASYLKKELDLDPLTIDQTSVMEKGERKYESPIYQWVVNHFDLESPVLMVDADGTPWSSNAEIYDMSVIWPRTEYIDGRPSWARLGRSSMVVDGSVCEGRFPCMLEVRQENTGGYVPSDRVLLKSNTDSKSVFYSDSDVWLITTDSVGAVVSQKEINKLEKRSP